MPDEFTPDDLPMLNAAMRAFPQVADGFRALVDVGSRLTFPVEGPEQLQQTITETGPVRYANAEIPVDDLPALMPAYYFPVESMEDFFAKVADVAGRVREPDGLNMPAARLREATAPQREAGYPSISGDEIRELAGLREGASTPSTGGIRRRDS